MLLLSLSWLVVVQYMGKANAMGGPRNMALNILCYSVVFAVFRVHPSVALKVTSTSPVVTTLTRTKQVLQHDGDPQKAVYTMAPYSRPLPHRGFFNMRRGFCSVFVSCDSPVK